VDNGGDWGSLNGVSGVNDSGQLVGTGILAGGDSAVFLLDIGSATIPDMGDADRDGDVDDDDLSLLLSTWGPCDSPCFCCHGDLNGDYIVDDDDLSLLLANWTGPLGPGPIGIPEPATMVLLGLAAPMLLRSCRKT